MAQPGPSVADLLVEQAEPQSVSALLAGRSPALLDENSDRHRLYEETVRGVSIEVASLATSDTTTLRFEVAVRAVVMGTAAQIEDALFPEQNATGEGRAGRLNRRYRDLLTQLGGYLQGDPDNAGDTTRPAVSRGSFPESSSYPDPARNQWWGGSTYGGGYW